MLLHPRQMLPVTLLAVIPLGLLSLYTTASGMAALTADLLGDAPLLAWAVAGGFSAAVQALLLWSVWHLARGRGVLRRAGLAALYLAAMGLSVGFAYGFWFQTIRGTDYSVETFRSASGQALTRAETYRRRYADFVAALEAVTVYSEATMQREIDSGGTCGDGSGPSEGPRARLRRRDAEQFQAQLEHFRGRLAEVEAVTAAIAELEAGFHGSDVAVHARALRGQVRRLAALGDDLRLTQLRAYLSERVAQAETGIHDADSGVTFTCPDPRLSALARSVATFELPPLPAPEAIRVFDGEDAKASIALAFGRIRGWVFGLGDALAEARPKGVPELTAERLARLRAGPQEMAREAADEGERLAMLMAVMVDALLLIAGLIAARAGGAIASWSRLEGLQREKPRLNPRFLERIVQVLELSEGGGNPAARIYHGVLGHTVRHGEHDYLWLPLYRQNREHARIKRLVDFLATLDALRLETSGSNRVPRWLRNAIGDQRADLRAFALYRVDRRFLSALLFEALRGSAEPAQEGADPPAPGAKEPEAAPGRRLPVVVGLSGRG